VSELLFRGHKRLWATPDVYPVPVSIRWLKGLRYRLHPLQDEVRSVDDRCILTGRAITDQ